MVTYVLDSSAVLRYLDNEAGADRVAHIIKLHVLGVARVVVSDLHWGEIAGVVYKRHGADMTVKVMSRLDAFAFESAPVTRERAVNAAVIKAKTGIPYADAFGVELASDSREHTLITADYDTKPAANRIQIEFLPANSPISATE
jgi:predicted nucleic acid-binding protein